MENIADYKEIVDVIKDQGGEAYKYCYQCGMCDTVCPWNRVRTFSMRKLIRQAAFGLTEIENEEIIRRIFNNRIEMIETGDYFNK